MTRNQTVISLCSTRTESQQWTGSSLWNNWSWTHLRLRFQPVFTKTTTQPVRLHTQPLTKPLFHHHNQPARNSQMKYVGSDGEGLTSLNVSVFNLPAITDSSTLLFLFIFWPLDHFTPTSYITAHRATQARTRGLNTEYQCVNQHLIILTGEGLPKNRWANILFSMKYQPRRKKRGMYCERPWLTFSIL